MKKIAVITNYNIPEKSKAALAVCDKLFELGCEVVVASFNRERIARNSDEKKYEYLNYVPLDKLFPLADLVIVLGGDGTILEASHRAAPLKKPMLGINLGRLGYMAELEINEIDLLEEVVKGNYEIDERMIIRVEILDKNGEQRYLSFALNDAVISKGSVSRIVDLLLLEGGVEVSNYRADGIIIATPTGSTAYSMSAGGAVVDPRLSCICVTPVCPHSLSSRPIIFPADSIIDVKNTCVREKMLYLTIDGKTNHELLYGETVRITRSNLTAKLVRLKNHGFYSKLQNKIDSNF